MQEPTPVATSGNATLIDLALVSNRGLVENCSVIPPLINSDHNGISAETVKNDEKSNLEVLKS